MENLAKVVTGFAKGAVLGGLAGLALSLFVQDLNDTSVLKYIANVGIYSVGGICAGGIAGAVYGWLLGYSNGGYD